MDLRGLTPVVLLLVLLAGGCGEDSKAPTTQSPAATSPSAADGTAATAPPSQAAEKAPAKKTPAAAPAEERGEAMAPTPATALRDTELKDKPFLDAKTLKRLPAQAALTIVGRSGGWLEVVSDGQRGWVRLLHVSSQPASRASTAQELESAAKMATGRGGSGNIVSTTGIRGLSEEQLRNAEPDPAEVQRLESYGVGREQAAEYARKHNLERRQVAQLPAPR